MPLTTALARRLLALLALAALVAAVVALAGGDTAHSEDASTAPPQTIERSGPQPPEPTAAVVAAREAAFEEQFALLRQPGGDAIPATTNISDPQLDVGGSRELTPAPAARSAGEDEAEVEEPDATVFVTPSTNGAQCLLAVLPELHGPGYACTYAAQAVEGYLLMTLSRDDVETELYGLMPDGVDEVTVELADGSTATLPVIDNGYLAKFDQPTISVSWIDADGLEQTRQAGFPG